MDNQKVLDEGNRKVTALFRGRVLAALRRTATDLNAMTDVPVWTHNLWDSVGVGIYENGTLIDYSVPVKGATEPRSGADDFPMQSRQWSGSEDPLFGVPAGVDVDKAWWGQAELFDMLSDPPVSILTSSGFAIYYVAAMPYAQVVDQKDDVLSEEMIAPTFLTHIRTNT
jgi:hypothetical protein